MLDSLQQCCVVAPVKLRNETQQYEGFRPYANTNSSRALCFAEVILPGEWVQGSAVAVGGGGLLLRRLPALSDMILQAQGFDNIPHSSLVACLW